MRKDRFEKMVMGLDRDTVRHLAMIRWELPEGRRPLVIAGVEKVRALETDLGKDAAHGVLLEKVAQAGRANLYLRDRIYDKIAEIQ